MASDETDEFLWRINGKLNAENCGGYQQMER